MGDWTTAFGKWMQATNRSSADVARLLDVSKSVVHYWLRGALPRSTMRARIEKVSKRSVRAGLPRRAAA